MAKKALDQWVRSGCRREAQRHWREKVQPATQAQIQERIRLAQTPNDAIDSNATKASSKRGKRVLFGTKERTAVIDRVSQKPLEPALGDWDDHESDWEIEAEDPDLNNSEEDSEEDEEDEYDTITEALEQAPEDESVVFELDEVDAVGDGSAPEPDLDEQRLMLITQCLALESRIDTLRGKHECQISKWDVAGDQDHLCSRIRLSMLTL